MGGFAPLAAQALGSSLARLAGEAIPALIKQLDDPDDAPCCFAARALGNFHARARDSVTASDSISRRSPGQRSPGSGHDSGRNWLCGKGSEADPDPASQRQQRPCP